MNFTEWLKTSLDYLSFPVNEDAEETRNNEYSPESGDDGKVLIINLTQEHINNIEYDHCNIFNDDYTTDLNYKDIYNCTVYIQEDYDINNVPYDIHIFIKRREWRRYPIRYRLWRGEGLLSSMHPCRSPFTPLHI